MIDFLCAGQRQQQIERTFKAFEIDDERFGARRQIVGAWRFPSPRFRSLCVLRFDHHLSNSSPAVMYFCDSYTDSAVALAERYADCACTAHQRCQKPLCFCHIMRLGFSCHCKSTGESRLRGAAQFLVRLPPRHASR